MLALALRAALAGTVLAAGVSPAGVESLAAQPAPPANAETTSGYPRDRTLSEIHIWINKERMRLDAEDARRSEEMAREDRRQRGIPEPTGWRCGSGGGGMPRPEVMSREEWTDLASRCRDELRDGTTEQRQAAFEISHDLSYIATFKPEIPFDMPTDFGEVCLSLFTDPSPEIRRSAAGAAVTFSEFIPGLADAAILPLLPLLKDEDLKVRQIAAWCLSSIAGPKPEPQGFGQQGSKVVAALLPLLNDPDQQIRFNSFIAIGYSGEAGRIAVPRLIELVERRPPASRADQRMAMLSLGYLKQHAAAAVPAIRTLLRSTEEGVRYRATSTLRNMGPVAREAVPDLIEILASSDQIERHTAAMALGAIGPDASDAVPRLLHMLREGAPDSGDGECAAMALGEIGPDAREAIPDLIAALDSSDKSLRSSATRALGNIGPEAIAAYEKIQQLIDNDPEALQGQGPQILAKILGQER